MKYLTYINVIILNPIKLQRNIVIANFSLLQISNQKENYREIAEEFSKQPQNQKCFDCGQPNPSWSSCRLGIFLCLRCSGQHRSYGTHISFVRSCGLDNWTLDQIKVLLAGGNDKFERFLRQKQISKPVNYKSEQMQSILEEYRQLLIKNSNDPKIIKIIQQYQNSHQISIPKEEQIQQNTIQEDIEQQNQIKEQTISNKIQTSQSDNSTQEHVKSVQSSTQQTNTDKSNQQSTQVTKNSSSTQVVLQTKQNQNSSKKRKSLGRVIKFQ